MKAFRILAASLCAATMLPALISCASTEKTPSLTIAIHPENNSAESGAATLTQRDDGVLVAVRLTNAPADAQPTHIHMGTCREGNGDLAYGLQMTENGQAETLVTNVTLAELLKTPHVINVHKSANEMGTYVACGDIR